jgi:hypothetical protein
MCKLSIKPAVVGINCKITNATKKIPKKNKLSLAIFFTLATRVEFVDSFPGL